MKWLLFLFVIKAITALDIANNETTVSVNSTSLQLSPTPIVLWHGMGKSNFNYLRKRHRALNKMRHLSAIDQQKLIILNLSHFDFTIGILAIYKLRKDPYMEYNQS